MSSPPRPSPTEEILTRLVEDRLKRLASRFGNDALAWLAVAPTWTEPAASAASFPSRDTPLKEFLDEASDQGLVDRDPPLRSDPELGRGFWISEKDREPVLEFLRHHTAFGTAKLAEVTVQIALRLEKAKDATPLPDELDYWSDLAKQAQAPFEIARQLGDAVAALTRDKKTGEALARVDAGRSLARTLGSTHLDAAIGVGSRRIGLAYRQAADDRHLKRYFSRKEQEQAFEALLDPLSKAWALHYLGVGGAGKTMLMRWITTPQNGSARSGRDRVVSRIDFDDLKPEYPVRKPGQLLLDLAVELRSFGRSTQEEQLFKTINDAVQDLHAILSVAPPPSNPLFNVERKEFDRILRPFCDLVSVLPPPVILVLDTCEELARVPVANGILPSIEATFSILQRVHQQVPSMRVIFAGRRPLASSGSDWNLRAETEDAARQHGFRQFLKHREFLALHEVRGVTHLEGHDFLEGRLGRPLPRDLEDAVFTRSRDPGRAADIVYTGPGIRTVSTGERYSLFDLALYADWLREDPALDAARIASGTSDPYVDLRIVQRVRQPAIRAALPAIAALGRFDAPMLRGAFPASLSEDEYDTIYREVGDYEWIDLQRESGSSDKLFLEVDRNLLPRIRSYFAQPSRQSESAQAIAGLVPGLASFIRRTRLGDLSVHHLSAALAILRPGDAARLWVEALLRVRTQADSSWLRTTVERLMGAEFETAKYGPLERGFDLAARAVAVAAGSLAARPLAEGTQNEWPDETTADWVARCTEATRADGLDQLLTTFTCVPKAPEPILGPDRMPDAVLARRMSEEEAAAIVGALERRIDIPPPPSRLEPRFTGFAELAGAAAAWASALKANNYPPSLVGMAQMLTAKSYAAAWNIDDARAWAERALKTAAATSDNSDGLWLFWRAPDAWCDRIRHELLLLHGDVEIESFPDPAGWLAGALSRNESIDGERLASAIERHLLDRALPEPSELGISEVADKYVVERVPTTSAHRRTPGLFVTLAMKRAALGDFSAADTALQTRALEAERTQADPDTVFEATLARVGVACLSRDLPRELPSVVKRLTRDMKERASAEDVFAMKVLVGSDVTEGFTSTPHDTWRTTYFESHGAARKALGDLQWQRFFGIPPGEVLARPPRVALANALDSVEVLRLASTHEVTLAIPPPSQTTYVADGEDLIRVMLRLYALHPIPDDELSSRVEISRPLGRLLLGVTPGEGGVVERNDLVGVVRQIAKASKREMLNTRASGQDAQYDPEGIALRLVSHFGIRRWTALAQQEGELLALRLPQEGGRLLQLAAALANVTPDPQAAVAAATAASLAVFRTLTHEREAAVHRAQADAWTLAAGDAGWHAIETAAGEIADEARWSRWDRTQDALPSRGGWVARAVLSLVARTQSGDQRQWSRAGDRVLRSFPDQAMAPEIALVVGTSVEPVPAVVDEAPAAAPRREPSQLLAASPILMTVALGVALVALWIYLVRINAFGATGTPTPSTYPFLIPLVIGTIAVGVLAFATGGPAIRTIVPVLLLLFVSICFCYWFVGFVADLLLPDWLVGGRLTQSWRVIAMIVVLGGASAFEPVFRNARSALARGSEASIWTNSASSHADLRTEIGSTSSIELQLSCRSRGLQFPFFTWETETFWSRTFEMSAVQPYAATSATIAADDVRPFVDLREVLREELWPVPIESGPASYQPWEGVLGLAVAGVAPDSTPKTDEPVFFYRWGPPRSTARPDAWAVGHVQVLGAPDNDVWVDRAIPRASVNWLNIGSPVRPQSYTIVHAIGTPVVTSFGPRLELADGTGFLDAHMLPDRLPLLILQQQPADSQARVTSDREQAAVLRAVAADLFESTCDAVIVIPSLPPELADRVIKKIAASVSTRRLVFHWLDGWAGSASAHQRSHTALARLATAVRSARDLVLVTDGFERFAARLTDMNPHLEGDRWNHREVAWDLCLFARPRNPGGAIEMQRTRHT